MKERQPEYSASRDSDAPEPTKDPMYPPLVLKLDTRVFDGLLLWLGASGVRTLGASWGSTNPDEHLNQAVRILAGELAPPELFYPPLTNYLNAAACAAMFVVGRLLGVFDGVDDLQRLWFTEPMPFYVAARLAHAFLSGLLAPIAYLAARSLGQDRLRAGLVGLVAGLIPVSVWFAHLAKPQNGMVTAVLAAVCFALVYLQRRGGRRLALGLGVAAGVAQAFMQNAVILLFPLAIFSLLVPLVDRRIPWSTLCRDAAWALTAALVTWSVLSTVVILYFREFIEYQVVQSQMSLRESSLRVLWEQAPKALSWTRGLNPIGVVIIPIALVFTRRRDLGVLGGTLLLVALYLAYSIGDRVPPRLFLGFMVTLNVLGALSLSDMSTSLERRPRRFGWAGLTLLLAGQLIGSSQVVAQALAVPPEERIREALYQIGDPQTSRVLAASVPRTGVRPSIEALEADRLRFRRLSEKYGVPLFEERGNTYRARAGGSWYIREIPWVIGGLEYTPPEEVKVVKAYAWPVQYEEWKLDHWINQGFDIFILWNLPAYTSPKRTPQYYVDFHLEILERCKIAAEFHVNREIFNEMDFVILNGCR